MKKYQKPPHTLEKLMSEKYLEVKCLLCDTFFLKRAADINRTKNNFCSRGCSGQYNLINYCKTQEKTCLNCNTKIFRQQKEISKNKTNRFYCSHSCRATFSNKSRKNTNRSKIEIEFGQELAKLFPTLKFIYNDRIVLDGYELDIYIPELKLAIEWNGTVHYQPIYGEDKLNKIQYRDYQKQLLCQKLDIDLIIISDYYSKKEIIQESLSNVSDIIRNKMSN